MKMLCISAGKFSNEYVTTYPGERIAEFHHKYHNASILLINDVHFISGKEPTEDTFFCTFHELHNANHRIVITSDCSPQEIPQLAIRPRSRFEWRLIVHIQPPDINNVN
jgi:chromosomal replication initiator protein